MGKKAILCISDLHITKGTEDVENTSLLEMNDELVKRLKNAVKDYEIQYLFILGDIANTGNKYEYERAKKILNTFMTELNIRDKKNVFIIPGNHDIDWIKYKYLITEEAAFIEDKNVHKYQEHKLNVFKTFYDDFYDGTKQFKSDMAIFDVTKLEEARLCLLCVNTLWHESYLSDDHYGYIDYDTLQKNLENIKEDIKGYTTVAIFHHMPNFTDENGNMYIRNWNSIVELFNEHNIGVFLGGHAHYSQSALIRDTFENCYVLTGSLSSLDTSLNNFLLLIEGEDNNQKGYEVLYFGRIVEDKGNWYWNPLPNKPNTIKFLPISMNNLEPEPSDSQLPFSDENKENVQETLSKTDILETAREIVLNSLKEQRLFQSGHFHWSKDGRTHSYIKTNYFFENSESLDKLKISFANIIKENNLKTDLLIGYAMQGNVLGPILAASLNLHYTYIPELNKRYPKYEKKLPKIDDCKYITIIIDIVYTQHIIKQIIDRLKEDYSTLQVLNVCSIFYASDSDFRVNGYLDVNVNFHYILEVELNRCPYKKVEDCIIYMQQLDTVHELFDRDEID